MQKAVYNEDTISDFPISSDYHNQFQMLREELDKMEAERDSLLYLLHELNEVDGEEELEEVMTRIREITDNRPNPILF